MSGNNRRVRLSIGRTIQPAPYEAIKMDIAIEEDLPPGTNMDVFINNKAEYIKEKLGELGCGF